MESFELLPYPNEVDKSDMDKEVLRVMSQHKVVGLSASIIKCGHLHWSNTYGWADLRRKIPAVNETVFRVASVSKIVTATALMQQFEQGKFHLDDDISPYLHYPVRNPNYPDEKITFLHLLTHTSSLRSDENDTEVYVNFSLKSQIDSPPSLRELLMPGGEYFNENVWSDAKPGDAKNFAYSNLGAIVVATLVEILSGERFDRYCKAHIFEPLGMQQSTFNLQEVQRTFSAAELYAMDGNGKFIVQKGYSEAGPPMEPRFGGYTPGINGSLFGPQGNLHTNALDFSRFVVAFIRGGEYDGTRILKENTVRLMQKVHWAGSGSDGFYRTLGLQFQITDDLMPGMRLIGHTGEAYGLVSSMYFSPDHQFGFCFMTNGSDYQPGNRSAFFDVQESLADLFYRKWVG